jgi:hypothetical protein
VATFEQVGVFTVTNSYDRRGGKRAATLRKQGGNVVTYFCTPRGHVLHFVVGPVTPEQLLASAQWSHETYQGLIEQEENGSTLERRREWMAVEHDKQLEKDAEAVGEVAKWLSGTAGIPKIAGSEALLQTAKGHLLALKNATGDDAHQLLHDRPLPKLRDIEAPVFEVLAGQPFSRRAHHLQERVLDNVKQVRPTLLVVADPGRVDWQPQRNGVAAAPGSEPDLSSFLPQTDRVMRHLHAFNWEVLSSGELTMVIAALDHEPIKLPHPARPKFVIINRQGEIANVVTDKYPVGVLARILESQATAEPGPTARSSDSAPSQVSPEKVARGKLRLAKSLLAERPEKAYERLVKIVRAYPKTETADEARKLLASSEK